MTRRSIDWRNPLGQETYDCFRYICTMEKNILEAARDNRGFSTFQPSLPPTNTPCTEMFTLTPKDSWIKTPRGQICYTYLKPKGPKGYARTRDVLWMKEFPRYCCVLHVLHGQLPKDGHPLIS